MMPDLVTPGGKTVRISAKGREGELCSQSTPYEAKTYPILDVIYHSVLLRAKNKQRD